MSVKKRVQGTRHCQMKRMWRFRGSAVSVVYRAVAMVYMTMLIFTFWPEFLGI